MIRRVDLFLISLVAVGLYLPTLFFDFAYDDVLQITFNDRVSGNAATTEPWWSLFFHPTPPGNLYRPLTTLTYALTFKAAGLLASLYHATNILLYAVACVLASILYARILPTRLIALFASFFFVTHPLHVEGVANVIGRAEVLAAIFVFTSLLSADRLVRTNQGRDTALFAACCGMAFLAAALCKESSIAALPLILWYAYLRAPTDTPRQITLIRLFPVLSAVLGAAIFSLILRYGALGPQFLLHPDGKEYIENPLFNLSARERLIPALKVLGDYLRMLVFPLSQSSDYSERISTFMDKVYSLDGGTSFAVLLGWLWTSLRTKSTSLRFLGIWTLATFLFTVNLLTPIGTVMGDRLAFLPSFGSCGVLALAIGSLEGHSRRYVQALGLILLVLYTGRTSLRIPSWRDNDTLFRQQLIDRPESPKAHYNYATLLILKHQDNEAEKSLKQAMQLHPKYLLAARALADIMLREQRWGALEFWYRRILEINPRDEVVQKNLAELQRFKERKD